MQVAISYSRSVVSPKRVCAGLVVVLCYCLVAASGASAQQYFNTVDTFNGTNGGGSQTAPVIQAANGNLYGTSYQSGVQTCDNGFDGEGSCGSVFQVTPTGTLSTLYEFCQLANCADGFWPTGALVQGTNGSLYGETQEGGANNGGTVFEITPQGVLTTLYSFCSAGPQAVQMATSLMEDCCWVRMATFMELLNMEALIPHVGPSVIAAQYSSSRRPAP